MDTHVYPDTELLVCPHSCGQEFYLKTQRSADAPGTHLWTHLGRDTSMLVRTPAESGARLTC